MIQWNFTDDIIMKNHLEKSNTWNDFNNEKYYGRLTLIIVKWKMKII
jgi:hypothetical protein